MWASSGEEDGPGEKEGGGGEKRAATLYWFFSSFAFSFSNRIFRKERFRKIK